MARVPHLLIMLAPLLFSRGWSVLGLPLSGHLASSGKDRDMPIPSSDRSQGPRKDPPTAVTPPASEVLGCAADASADEEAGSAAAECSTGGPAMESGFGSVLAANRRPDRVALTLVGGSSSASDAGSDRACALSCGPCAMWLCRSVVGFGA